MATATPTRLGQNLATGDAMLFLKIFLEKSYLLLVEKTK